MNENDQQNINKRESKISEKSGHLPCHEIVLTPSTAMDHAKVSTPSTSRTLTVPNEALLQKDSRQSLASPATPDGTMSLVTQDTGLCVETDDVYGRRFSPGGLSARAIETSQLRTPIVVQPPRGFFRSIQISNLVCLMLHAVVGIAVTTYGLLHSNFRIPLTIQVLEGNIVTTRIISTPKLLPVRTSMNVNATCRQDKAIGAIEVITACGHLLPMLFRKIWITDLLHGLMIYLTDSELIFRHESIPLAGICILGKCKGSDGALKLALIMPSGKSCACPWSLVCMTSPSYSHKPSVAPQLWHSAFIWNVVSNTEERYVCSHETGVCSGKRIRDMNGLFNRQVGTFTYHCLLDGAIHCPFCGETPSGSCGMLHCAFPAICCISS